MYMKYCYLVVLGLALPVFGAKKEIDEKRTRREGILFQHLSPEGQKKLQHVAEQLPAHLKTYLSLEQKPKVIPPMPPPPPGSMAQTEAYLSIPALKKQVEQTFATQLTKFADIIQKIKDKEKELLKTHFVFYHAQPSDYMIMHDFMKEMTKWLQVPKTENFVALRVPAATFNIQDIYAFIDQKMKVHGAMSLDVSGDMPTHLVSVNFSLFGNSNPAAIFGKECSFEFFSTNTSASGGGSPVKFLVPLMQQLHLPSSSIIKYTQQLTTLTQDYLQQWGYKTCKPAGGVLHQICIPRSIVDDYGYLSVAYGAYGDPNNPIGEIGRSYSSKTKKTTLFNFLSTLQSNPTSLLPGAIDNLQARLVITTEGMLNPAGGVKIFTYTTLDAKCEKEYKAKLAEIVKNIMFEWYKQAGATQETLDAFLKVKELKEQIPVGFTPASPSKPQAGSLPKKGTTPVVKLKPWEVKKAMQQPTIAPPIPVEKPVNSKEAMQSLQLLAESLSELSKTVK